MTRTPRRMQSVMCLTCGGVGEIAIGPDDPAMGPDREPCSECDATGAVWRYVDLDADEEFTKAWNDAAAWDTESGRS